MKSFLSLLAAAATMLVSGAATAERLHLREGAIMCPYPWVKQEAALAASRGDNQWFQSTGCSQAFGKPEIVVITDPRAEPLTVIWQVRVPRLNLTTYVGSWEVKGPKPEVSSFDYVLRNLTREQGPLGSQLTASENDFLANLIKQQLYPCWNVPTGARDAKELSVRIRASVNPDGTISAASIVDNGTNRTSDPLIRATEESARQAFFDPKCTPLKLPSDKYETWKELLFHFDPRELL